MSQRAARMAFFALTLIALGALVAACAPAAHAPTATTAPAVIQPTAAVAAPTSAPAATLAPTAAPMTQPAAAAATATQPANQTVPTAPPATTAAKPASVSFSKDVLPIFEQSCVKCHGGDKTEAALALKTYAQLTKGSENGPVIKPGDAANSFLVQQIVNGKMPKRANKLPQAQIDIIAAWVNAGAPNN